MLRKPAFCRWMLCLCSFIAPFVLWADPRVATLRSGDALLQVRPGEISLTYADLRCLSLGGAAVTLEVDGETLAGPYRSVRLQGEELRCLAQLKAPGDARFEVEDHYAPDGPGHFRLTRQVRILQAGTQAGYFNSYFGLTRQDQAGLTDFEYFVPGIWYRDNAYLRPGSLAQDYTDNYFYFREDRLPLPLVASRQKATGLSFDLLHLEANPRSFYGENGVQRIVDARMQFGSLGFAQTGSQSAVFVFPGIEGEHCYIGRFPHGAEKGFAYRSHPVQTGVEHAYSLSFGFSHTPDYPTLVESTWKRAWDCYDPQVYKVDVKDAYEASIEVLDAYLMNLNGAPGWPFSIYLPNGLARAYNYQMGFIGFQISNAYFLLRYGLEQNKPSYVQRACEVLDFWVEHSQMPSGLVRPWADAYVDRDPTWRDYEAFMRVCAGGMEGMMGAWNVMQQHGTPRPAWLAYCKRYAHWLGAHQEPDGSFYLRYDWRTGKATHDSKYTTSNIIRFLVELYAATGSREFLETALKAGEFSYDCIHHDYLYVGGVIDNPNVKDRESGQMALYAFLALYDATGDEKWKEAAVQAARYTETFMFAYHVPMSEGDVYTDFPPDRSIVGQTLIATGHSGIDNGLAFSSFQYYRLWLLTDDPHFLHMARLIQNNTLSIMDLDGSLGYRYRGLLTECFNPQGNRGHSVRQQLPWNQASILEPMHRFMDAFGEWDIDVIETWPLAKRKAMAAAYARTQGLSKENSAQQ